MTESNRAQPPDRDDRYATLFLIALVVLIVAGGIWLVNELISTNKATQCLESGRRNCAPIETPAR